MKSIFVAAAGVACLAAVSVATASPSVTTHSQTARPNAAVALPNLAYVKAQVAVGLTAHQVFKAPGPPFAAKKARGKKLFYLPLTTSIPSTAIITHSAQVLAGLVGIRFTAYTTNGTPTAWVQGINEAVAEKPNVLFLTADWRVLGPQLAQARSAGIKVIDGRNVDETERTPSGLDAIVGSPHLRAARLEVDYITLHSKGLAHVLIITNPESHISPIIVQAMKNEYAKVCGSGCKLTVVSVPVAKWATDIQGTVQSALINDPSITYVNPIYDGMVPFAIAGITNAGALGKVKIVSYNGTPSILALVQSGQVMMDVGESFNWDAWAQMDQIMRVMLGLKPAGAEHTTLRIWDKTNIAAAGSPPRVDQGYGTSFIPGYEKLWGLKLKK